MRQTKLRKLKERYKKEHDELLTKSGFRQVKKWYNRLNKLERMKI